MHVIYILYCFLFSGIIHSSHFDEKEAKSCFVLVDGLFGTPFKIHEKEKKSCFTKLASYDLTQSKGLLKLKEYAEFHANSFLRRAKKFDIPALETRINYIFKQKKLFPSGVGNSNTCFFQFLVMFHGAASINYLTKEEFHGLSCNYGMKNGLLTLEEALKYLKSSSVNNQIIKQGIELVPFLSDARFEELLQQAERAVVLKPGQSVRKLPYKHLDVQLSLPAWRMLNRIGDTYHDVTSTDEFKEIVDFASSSIENLKFFFIFSSVDAISSIESSNYPMSSGAKDLRRAIFFNWMKTTNGGTPERRGTFLRVRMETNGIRHILYDEDIVFSILQEQTIDQNNQREQLSLFQAVFARHFKGSLGEFLISPDYNDALGEFEKNYDKPWCRVLFNNPKNDYFSEIKTINRAKTAKNGFMTKPFYPSRQYLQDTFSGDISPVLKSISDNGISNFRLFKTGNSKDVIEIIIPLREVIFNGDKNLYKMGYITYQELPLAAWRFLHGRPYPYEEIPWQEMADVVYDYYTQKEKLRDYLLYFRDEVEPHLFPDSWAQKTRALRQEIIRVHALEHPQEYKEALKENLIEPELKRALLKEMKKKLSARSLVNSEDIPDAKATEKIPVERCVVETEEENLPQRKMLSEENIVLEQPSVKEEIASKALPIIEKQVESPTQIIPLPIPEIPQQKKIIVNIDSDSEDEVIEYDIPKELQAQYNISTQSSDYLLALYCYLCEMPFHDDKWKSRLKEFFDYFISFSEIEKFFVQYDQCLSLNTEKEKREREIQELVIDAEIMLNDIPRDSVQGAFFLSEFLHIHEIKKTLKKYLESCQLDLRRTNSFTLCRESVRILSVIECLDSLGEESSHDKSYRERINCNIVNNFPELIQTVKDLRFNLKNTITYCVSMLPLIKQVIERLEQKESVVEQSFCKTPKELQKQLNLELYGPKIKEYEKSNYLYISLYFLASSPKNDPDWHSHFAKLLNMFVDPGDNHNFLYSYNYFNALETELGSRRHDCEKMYNYGQTLLDELRTILKRDISNDVGCEITQYKAVKADLEAMTFNDPRELFQVSFMLLIRHHTETMRKIAHNQGSDTCDAVGVRESYRALARHFVHLHNFLLHGIRMLKNQESHYVKDFQILSNCNNYLRYLIDYYCSHSGDSR